MEFTALQIASFINGTIEGNEEKSITTISKIEEATDDALCFIANPKYEHFLYETQAAIVIVNQDLQLHKIVSPTLIRVPDAYAAFASLMELYQKMTTQTSKVGIELNAFVHETAILGKDIYIGAFAYIGEHAKIADGVQIFPQVFVGSHVKIGAGTKINAGVKIYDHCEIGENVLLHSGAVIGSDGFGFAPQKDGTFKKVPQLGNVILEDNVEVGANTTIDRATMGSTIMRKNVKLDNLVQIAHNVVIDENTAVAAQTGISGSTKIGKNCMIGGQCGIVGHIQIADGTILSARSGISKSIKEKNTILSGFFAFDYKNSLKSQAIFRNLPELEERLRKVEDHIK